MKPTTQRTRLRTARWYPSVVQVVLLAVTAIVVALSQPSPWAAGQGAIRRVQEDQLPKNVQVSPGNYLVEFNQPSKVDISSDGSPLIQNQVPGMAEQHAGFLAYLQRNLPHVAVDRSYESLFNGVSVSGCSTADVQKISRVSGVKSVFPVLLYLLDTEEIVSMADDAMPLDTFANNSTRVVNLRQQMQLDGSGVKVGIIDTGIDYLHPAFAMPGKNCTAFKGPGCRVQGGRNFLAGTKKGANESLDDPMDCAGHGTHVAGIVGGNDTTFTGNAPGVTLYAYRIFSCSGGTTTDLIITAMEKAFEDGMDVVNLSLGGGASFDDYPDAKAVDKLSAGGVIVVSALGNSGAKGLFQVAAPSIGKSGFGVASIDNFFINKESMGIEGVPNVDHAAVSIETKVKAKEFPKGSLKIIPSPTKPTDDGDGCSAYPKSTFDGGIALIHRGKCTFVVKAGNALDAGAQGIIFFNNIDGYFSAAFGNESFPAPVAYIPSTEGTAMWNAATENPGSVKVTFSGERKAFKNPTGGLPSSFSSWGLGSMLELKPDIAGIGGEVFSAWPLSIKPYNTISGTSMASPGIAGIMALYRQKYGKRPFTEMLTRVQNTAVPIMVNDTGVAFSVAKQGPGLVDALAFLATNVTVSPSRIAVRDTPTLQTYTTVLNITNDGTSPVSYKVSHIPSQSVLGEYGALQDNMQFSQDGAKVAMDVVDITVPPKGTQSVTVSIDPNVPSLGDGHWIMSGYIAFTPSSSETPLHVPYALMKGSYSTYPMLPVNGTLQPFIAEASLSTRWNFTRILPENVTTWYKTDEQTRVFSLDGNDMPVAYLETVHLTRLLAMAVHNATTEKRLGYIGYYHFTDADQYFLPLAKPVDRDTGDETYGWNGTYLVDPLSPLPDVRKADDGAYFWTLDVVRPSTTLDNFEHRLETIWRSPTIVIKRTNSTSGAAPPNNSTNLRNGTNTTMNDATPSENGTPLPDSAPSGGNSADGSPSPQSSPPDGNSGDTLPNVSSTSDSPLSP